MNRPQHAHLSVANLPRSVALADWGGDGDLDIVTASSASANISVRHNNGAGVFGSRVDFPVGSSPQIVALAKLGNDDDLDIATANANNTTILMNDGQGDFGTRSTEAPHRMRYPSVVGLEKTRSMASAFCRLAVNKVAEDPSTP